MADLALAVDVGGTKMAAGLVALDGTLVERAMRPTPATAGPDEAEVLWDNLAGVVGEMMAAARSGGPPRGLRRRVRGAHEPRR